MNTTEEKLLPQISIEDMNADCISTEVITNKNIEENSIVKIVSTSTESILNKGEAEFNRQLRAVSTGGVSILSLKVLGKVDNIELGNSPETKELVPLLTINQNNTFEVKITNNSTRDKYGTVGIFMNGRVIGNSSVRLLRNSTKTITLDMSVPGPGIHTLKVSVSGDSGGRFSADISKKFYWCAMKGKAVKFTVNSPSHKTYIRGEKAPYNVEIFNVGTERITKVHLKAMESNNVIINQALRFPSFLPPGGTVTFTANYTAHVAGTHTIKFELDPNKTEFNRTALMNAIGEDLIETVTGKWMPKIGDKVWVCGKKIEKGDLPEEANKHINSNIPVQVSVVLTIIGLAINPLNGLLLAGITISLQLNDYNQDNLAKKFNDFGFMSIY
ncbi:hypothetical protein [Crassaminicella indica]|uniref:CARDB protein n=1 Tax=Crassaminicella indica TaxID=2855394 RepID=A0ABX8RC38_9CLOT|nr:hypothetical protein [Crassaminicella indica]QXM05495.1 hypothetical protein KVH43_08900 [Crassaminicella indica]